VLHLRDWSAAAVAPRARRSARDHAECRPAREVRGRGTLAQIEGVRPVSKKGGNKTKAPPKAPMANKGPKKK
jgi:hypothetical protein